MGKIKVDIMGYSEITKEQLRKLLRRYQEAGVSFVELKVFADDLDSPLDKSIFGNTDLWDCIETIDTMARKYNIRIIPEIHGYYVDKIYEDIRRRGYLTHDIFFPGLLLDAIEKKRVEILALWIQEIIDEGYRTLTKISLGESTMLTDIQGMVPEEDLQRLMDQPFYYDKKSKSKMVFFSRVIQLFMPGIAVIEDSALAKMENISLREELINLLQLRMRHPVFHPKAQITVDVPSKACLIVTWQYLGYRCQLNADFGTLNYSIVGI